MNVSTFYHNHNQLDRPFSKHITKSTVHQTIHKPQLSPPISHRKHHTHQQAIQTDQSSKRAMPQGTLKTTDDLLICTACGAQYDTPLPGDHPLTSTPDPIPADDSPLRQCRICDDPRQFVPLTGQTFTTLGRMKNDRGGGYKNVFRRRKEDAKVWELWTEPKFGIGQRACILQTPRGNIMWDLVAYLDQDTVDKINELGGLEFIVISHPHFYTTWYDWSTTFQCPVYMAKVDAESWANRVDSSVISPSTTGAGPNLRLLTDTHNMLAEGLTAIIAGGHFPGSMLLHSQIPNTEIPTMFAADTIMAVPSANNPELHYFQPGAGTVSYTFMWSIPNMIPLDPDTVLGIWNAIKDPQFEFRSSYTVFAGGVVRALEGEAGLRSRVLESMKIFVKRAGWKDHVLLKEALP